MSKIIAIDLDGTLLNDELEVSKANIDAINQAISMGYHIVVCTGRPYNGMKHFIESFQYPIDRPFYLILGNGTSIRQGPELSALYEQKLPEETLESALKIFHDYPNSSLKLAGLNDFYFYGVVDESIPEILIEDARKNRMQVDPIHLYELNAQLNFNKLMFMAEPQILDEWEEYLNDIFSEKAETVRSTPIIFEILPKDTNKGTSLIWLANHLGISKDDIGVIGDALNDLSMFEIAETKIAMANAHEKIKKMSDIIVSSNNESGVAEAIKHLISNK